MTNADLLQRIVENGLDFLDRSLEDFETHPKYSVIHFHAGVELLLKARLMAEHWSLVVSKRQSPDWKLFQVGDFISVSLDEAAERLEKVVRSGLSKRELDAFRSLARHRNRMVHFFHEASNVEAADELLRKIAREQLGAWYFLYRLLTDRWSNVFSPWKESLEDFGKRLRKHDQYLQIAFEYLKQHLEKRANEGALFRDCPSCGFAALEIEEEVGELFEGTCLVCEFHERCLSAVCPDCDAPITFFSGGFGQCHSCGKKFDPQDLVHLIEADERGTKRYFESGMPAHCGECSGYETVVSHGGSYVCASCFNVYDEEDLEACHYCEV